MHVFIKIDYRHLGCFHLGLGSALSTLACKEIGIQQPLPAVLCWIEQVDVAVKDLRRQRERKV